MADISALGNLKPQDPVNLDGITLSTGKGKPFPQRGRYTFRVRPDFPKEAFGESKASGSLTVQIDPIIVGGPSDGFQCRFVKVSNKAYKQGTETVSRLGLFLKACGLNGDMTGDPQSDADKAEQSANLTFDGYLDWRLWARGEGRNSDGTPNGTDLILDGMEEFPKDDNGKHVPYIPSVTKTNEDGEPVMLRASVEITRYFAPADSQ